MGYSRVSSDWVRLLTTAPQPSQGFLKRSLTSSLLRGQVQEGHHRPYGPHRLPVHFYGR